MTDETTLERLAEEATYDVECCGAIDFDRLTAKGIILSALQKARKEAIEDSIRVAVYCSGMPSFTGPQREAKVRIVQALRRLAQGLPEDGPVTAKLDEAGKDGE